MSSSGIRSVPRTPSRWQRLTAVLAKVPDPRDRRGRRYPMAGMLAVAIGAVMAGARSFTAIG